MEEPYAFAEDSQPFAFETQEDQASQSQVCRSTRTQAAA